MWARCTNPKSNPYKNYGARGISVCERWKDFSAFISDMGRRPSEKHSLDRKNNGLGYSPDNCKWSTSKEQILNRRNTRWLTFKGVTKSVSQWLEDSPIKYTTFLYRLAAGWGTKEALFKKTRRR
jgi:hypothetical protein